MLHVVFEYADSWSGWKWKRQECVVESVRECIKLYGLGVDCDYRIISAKEVEE